MYEAGVHVFIYGHTRSEQPRRNIDVCLRPLIDELTQLWSSRTLTSNILRKQKKFMSATLMWTINDFLVYGMVSGKSTHGKLACP